MIHRTARGLLAVLLVAGVHVVAPTRATAEFRAATDCASHCAKTRGAEGCPPRCCLVGPETSSVATITPAAHVERPAVALVLPTASALVAAPFETWQSARREAPPRAGPLYLAILTLRL